MRPQSKAWQPLERYFPEVVGALPTIPANRFILDDEIFVSVNVALSFDDLLQRTDPAVSRINKLSVKRAATLIAFDRLDAQNAGTSKR